jgi:hypothetical protein
VSLPPNWDRVYSFIYRIWYNQEPTSIPTQFELIIPAPIVVDKLVAYDEDQLSVFDTKYQELMEP